MQIAYEDLSLQNTHKKQTIYCTEKSLQNIRSSNTFFFCKSKLHKPQFLFVQLHEAVLHKLITSFDVNL